MAFNLRITDLGRAALADGQNLGTEAIRLTKMVIGSGQGPGGAADDGRAALRNQRNVVALLGTAPVEGRIGVRAEFNPSQTYDVTEAGILGRVGSGAEELYAYWTDGGTVLASTLPNTRLVIAGVLEIAPAAAQVDVDIDVSVSLGDPGLIATVTAQGGRITNLENLGIGAALLAAMQVRVALAARLAALEAIPSTPQAVPGELKWLAGAATPAGWLAAEGQAVSRAIYADLFSAIGVVWGNGNGATTFNLPDFRGKFAMGVGPNDALGNNGGEREVTLAVDEMPAHTHGSGSYDTDTEGNHTHVYGRFEGDPETVKDADDSSITVFNRFQSDSTQGAGAHSHDVRGNSGSKGDGNAHQNLPPYAAAICIIKT